MIIEARLAACQSDSITTRAPDRADDERLGREEDELPDARRCAGDDGLPQGLGDAEPLDSDARYILEEARGVNAAALPARPRRAAIGGTPTANRVSNSAHDRDPTSVSAIQVGLVQSGSVRAAAAR